MKRMSGGLSLAFFAAIVAASITAAMPVSAADSTPEKSSPKARATAAAVPGVTAGTPQALPTHTAVPGSTAGAPPAQPAHTAVPSATAGTPPAQPAHTSVPGSTAGTPRGLAFSAPVPVVPAAHLPTLLEQLDLMGSPALDRSSDGLHVVTLPGGGRLVNLEGRFREYVVVTLDANGRGQRQCVSGLGAVRQFFISTSAPRPSRATEE